MRGPSPASRTQEATLHKICLSGASPGPGFFSVFPTTTDGFLGKMHTSSATAKHGVCTSDRGQIFTSGDTTAQEMSSFKSVFAKTATLGLSCTSTMDMSQTFVSSLSKNAIARYCKLSLSVGSM